MHPILEEKLNNYSEKDESIEENENSVKNNNNNINEISNENKIDKSFEKKRNDKR